MGRASLGIVAAAGGALALVLTFFACDDNTGQELGPGGYSGNGNGVGSLGVVDAAAPLTPQQRAEALYRALESDLVTTCGGACHGTGTAGGNPPTWLAPPDTYVSARAYQGIITSDPNQSKLMTKGPHAGPSLTTGTYKPLGDRVFAWLTQESLVLSLVHLPSTDPFAVTIGTNTVDIAKGETDDDAGAGLAGAKITFTAAKSGDILSLTKVTLVAPAGTGVRITHPIFDIVATVGTPIPDPIPDPVDTFSTVDQSIPAGGNAVLGTGDLFLFKWQDSNKLKIEFNKLEKATVVLDAGTTGGCKSPATFISSAKPELTKDNCTSCHAGSNAQATSALDLTQLGKDDNAACAQALNKVTLTNKPQSPIIQAPAGTLNHQGGKVADTQPFTNGMLGWINNE